VSPEEDNERGSVRGEFRSEGLPEDAQGDIGWGEKRRFKRKKGRDGCICDPTLRRGWKSGTYLGKKVGGDWGFRRTHAVGEVWRRDHVVRQDLGE